ncbi:tagaturonate reductase [Proteiniclasticum ruminis]|uniref:Tagaturonate reductase n=1 Tax=Proteiniclasticum ruminis TaxID=398199 RepID=A0A1G8KAL6_9CLOT|nr:tagaturonate reductase [Proteiniclasticum ruminis]SDI39890.1 tagaturonate reductase [Proteiniclasticum ruminis]
MLKNIKDVVEKKFGNRKEMILQYGEGNFLRAFCDWMVEEANEEGLIEGSIVLVQPISFGMVDKINEQEGLYTLIMRGLENGEKVERTKVITSVSRGLNPFEDYEGYMKLAESEDLKIVISNTTEAGISYVAGDVLEDQLPKAFPAKVLKFLYHRYNHFHGDKERGLLFLPVELIDNNGPELRRIVLQYAKEWNLPEEFIQWMEETCYFANTLVDRIVTGYPRDEVKEYHEKFGYEDNLLVTSEVFNLWVIEAPKKYETLFPIHKTRANVIFTDDVRPYKKRKVRILNGGHTSTVLAAYLAGHDYVGQFIEDEVFNGFLRSLIFDEIIPTIDLPKEELKEFAEAVFERFGNPYIKHRLLDISLNSVSKFTARCLPTLLDFEKENGRLPERMVFSLAALLKFYQVEKKEEGYVGIRENGETYPVKDDEDKLAYFEKAWKEMGLPELVKDVLGKEDLWQRNLLDVPGLYEATLKHLEKITQDGVISTLKAL